MQPESDRIVVLPSDPRNAETMSALMAHVYGTQQGVDFDDIFTADQYRHHMAIFPEGQFSAYHGERIVGAAASMRFHFDRAHPVIEPWWETINHGWLHHVPDGEWLYGVESHVDPEYQGRGIGGMLMQARFDTARLLNLRGMVAGSTLMSYGAVAHEATPEEYIAGVISGRYFDNNLSKQMIKGFRPLHGGIIPGYVDDPTALGWGTIIVWENPDYDPDAETRLSLTESERDRRYERPLRAGA